MNPSTPSGTRTLLILIPFSSFHSSETLPTGSGNFCRVSKRDFIPLSFFSFSSSSFSTDFGSASAFFASFLPASSICCEFLPSFFAISPSAAFFVSVFAQERVSAAFFARSHLSLTSLIFPTIPEQHHVFPVNHFVRPSENPFYLRAFLSGYRFQFRRGVVGFSPCKPFPVAIHSHDGSLLEIPPH